MQAFIQFSFITVLYVLVRAGDLALTAAQARDYIRAVFYGIAALLALVFVVLAIFHLG